MPFGWHQGVYRARRYDVELVTGQTLMVLGLLVLALLTVMWLLAATRRSQR